MKTTRSVSNKITMLKALLMLPLLLLTACMDDMFKSPFAIEFPLNNGVYIDDQLLDFVVTYDRTVSSADIFLNGRPIKDSFVYGPNSATASVTKIRKFLKEGKNTLSVDPMAFGPSVQFMVDTAGPEIIVTYGKVTGGSVDIRGELRDATSSSSLELRLVQVTGIDPDTGRVTRSTGPAIPLAINSDNTFSGVVDISGGVTIYNFRATDIHGHVSTKEYLADSDEISAMSISNAMRIAIGDSFVESLRPVIASSLYSSLQQAPIDIRHQCWNDPNKDGPRSQNPNGGFCAAGSTGLTPISANTTQDGSTFNPGLNPVSVDIGLGAMPTTIRRVFMDAGSTALLNRFKIEANDRLDIELVITEMTVALTIDGGWLLGNIDMTMTIGRIVADTGADVVAENKKVSVELVDSDFVLEDISVSETRIWGMELGGLVNGIIPILEGIIADLLPGIINPILNDNLQKIVIGAKVLSADDLDKEYFEYALNVETLKTDNQFGPGNPYDMIVGLETRFNLLEADPMARPTLGPVYVEDPVDVSLIYNGLGETGTNLSVALSSNALNQAFSSLYASGLSHMALVNGNVTYGADPAKPAGSNGQTRIRLYPQSPPYFILRPEGAVGGTASASLSYESATLYLDKYEGGKWKNQVELGVSFGFAVLIDQIDNVFQITIDGAPVFDIHTMVNNTGWPVSKGMLQSMMDVVTMYFLPELSDVFTKIDLNQLADSSLNGTQVLFQTDRDDLTQTLTAGGCPIQSSSNGDDGNYDYVCHTINLGFNTSVVSSIGEKGTNLFFQMEARDPNIPAAPAIPRLDLDGDGVLDYRDNCAAPMLMLQAAVKAEGGLKTTELDGNGNPVDPTANMDTDGNPVNNFDARLASHINRWVACDLGFTAGVTCGDYAEYYRTGNVVDIGSGTPALPPGGEQTWWNSMRKGDAAISNLGSYPWVTMRYSNASQLNTDGDRTGELCEDDADRDGIYTDNGAPFDTCPAWPDASNNPGSCTIDAGDGETAQFVLFKNKARSDAGQDACISHREFTGATDAGIYVDGIFDQGAATDGRTPAWAACDPSNPAVRFYVEAAPVAHTPRYVDDVSGDPIPEKVVHIYSNKWKQTEPGFYDSVNHHYLAITLANQQAGSSTYWQWDDIIVTTMEGYEGRWMQWLLSQSQYPEYPWLIESFRSYEVTGRRDCIFEKGISRPDADGDSCVTSPAASAFQILLGNDMVPWQGRFKAD